MILKYFYDKKLAQASYLVGCAATGEALIIDPSRDIQQYIEAAGQEGLQITHVTETHIHADYVSGTRELSAATSAKMFLSDMGDANWKYGFMDDPLATPVQDGDQWMVGNIKVEVLHTPGHTPEHISFMITDTAGADRPIGIFTGDFLFVGDVGRPDLLEEAAGLKGTKEVGARQQYATVERFKQLPDYLQIWPAHGAGSACGKALGALPSTTLGYEKLFNPAFQFDTEEEFVAWLLDGQPEAPYYFAQMKKVNKEGPALIRELPEPEQLSREELEVALKTDQLVLDMRNRDQFAGAFVPGTINIPNIGGGCVNHVGWFVDFEQPTYVIANDAEEAAFVINNLRAIGVDRIEGFFAADVIRDTDAILNKTTSEELRKKFEAGEALVLDVRGINEYNSMHISGAKHIPLGYLPKHLDEIPKDKTVVTQCASGYRLQIAASLLRRYGFENVATLNEGMASWSKTLPVE